ncbi:MAG: hypothetical protein ACHQRK_09435 [Gemmatimonadales bacterium]
MWTNALARTLATMCGVLSALSAAASAPILFGWLIDSTRPISIMPLLASAALLLAAGALFVARRLLLVQNVRRPAQ